MAFKSKLRHVGSYTSELGKSNTIKENQMNLHEANKWNVSLNYM